MRKPHLAVDADIEEAKFPLWGFSKIDGVRLMHITGSATGRSLKPHGNRFTTKRFSDPIYTGFDGEATFGDVRGQSLCRDTTGAISRHEGAPDIVWNVFDWIHTDTVNMEYEYRYESLLRYIGFTKPKGVNLLPYTVINNKEEMIAFYEKQLELGYEGAIFRDPKGLHKDGRATVKSNAYLRMKPSSDKDAIVVSLVEAMENTNEAKVNELGHTERSTAKAGLVGKGMVGMLVCKDVDTGQIIDVGPGEMTHDMRKYYWNNQSELVGTAIRYRSLDTGIKEKPRFARWVSPRALTDIS